MLENFLTKRVQGPQAFSAPSNDLMHSRAAGGQKHRMLTPGKSVSGFSKQCIFLIIGLFVGVKIFIFKAKFPEQFQCYFHPTAYNIFNFFLFLFIISTKQPLECLILSKHKLLRVSRQELDSGLPSCHKQAAFLWSSDSSVSPTACYPNLFPAQMEFQFKWEHITLKLWDYGRKNKSG